MAKYPSSPGPSSGGWSTDPELRARAAKSLKRKQEFRQHLVSYVIVNGFLVALWAITSRGYFWPVWPMLGWGIGLAFHAFSLRWDDQAPTPEQIDAEARRIAERDGYTGSSGGASASDPYRPSPGPQDAR